MAESALGFASFAARVLVATVLIGAGLAKVLDGQDQGEAGVRAYALVPDRLARPVSIVLPIAELTIAFGLIVGVFMPIPALAASVLFVAFGVAMAINLARRRVIPCGCFGARADSPISWGRVGFEGSLAILALVASAWPRGWAWPIGLLPEGSTLRAAHALPISLAVLGGLASVLLVRAAKAMPTIPVHSHDQTRETPRDVDGERDAGDRDLIRLQELPIVVRSQNGGVK